MQSKCNRCGNVPSAPQQLYERDTFATSNVSQSTIEYLVKTSYDTMCDSCLNELETLVSKAKKTRLPLPGSPLKEGLHYYMDDGMFVFTEFYLLARGFCCRKGCRHCAWGFRNS